MKVIAEFEKEEKELDALFILWRGKANKEDICQ